MKSDYFSIVGPVLNSGKECEKILRRLPEWFGDEQTMIDYGIEIDGLPTFMINIHHQVCGFISPHSIQAAQTVKPDLAVGHELLLDSVDLALPQGAPVLDALYLEGTVAYLALLGRYDEAFVLMRAAAAWRERLGVPVAPVNRRRQERLRQEVERRASRKELAGL